MSRILGRLEDIPDGRAKGYPPTGPGFVGLLAVRRGGQVFVYANSCPHLGVPLEIMPDRFLDHHGTAIVCAVHAALFRVEDGYCTTGPCKGDSLEAIPASVDGDGLIHVPMGAGR